MGVKRILYMAGAKMGQNPSDPNQRLTLLRFLNEAAEELYDQSDMPGSLMEGCYKVNGDQTITFPSNIGQVRAIREAASMQVWHLNQMRPRYNQFNWIDMWRNYRIKNTQALQATVTNQSIGVIAVAQVETPPVVVTVSGPTATSTMSFENITMSQTQMQTSNEYLDYAVVKKDRVNNYDVILSDVDGKVMTVIPNNEIEALYQIIDVSNAPWLPQNTSPLDNYVEVLFKRKLTWLSNDSDEFPAFGYDRIIVNKMLQLWFEEQSKVDTAKAYDDKATRSLARKTEDANRGTEDMVALTANPHDTIQKRVGSGLRRRYSLYAGRKY